VVDYSRRVYQPFPKGWLATPSPMRRVVGLPFKVRVQ
jgi:hypothetical protein